jgi:predicted RNase H-like HicB family nuclease
MNIKEKTMKLKAILRPEPVGGYSVSIPALPGCHSEGETLEEALSNIREAAELWLEVADERSSAEQGNSPTVLCREIDL